MNWWARKIRLEDLELFRQIPQLSFVTDCTENITSRNTQWKDSGNRLIALFVCCLSTPGKELFRFSSQGHAFLGWELYVQFCSFRVLKAIIRWKHRKETDIIPCRFLKYSHCVKTLELRNAPQRSLTGYATTAFCRIKSRHLSVLLSGLVK